MLNIKLNKTRCTCIEIFYFLFLSIPLSIFCDPLEFPGSPISIKNNQGINMAHKNDCIFCQIVEKKTKAWVIWESTTHIAFLSIYPNMKGVTVVIPKDHKSSYAFDLEDQKLAELILAAKQVAKILDSKLEGVGRTALILEGFGVDHVHAKLYPLPNTAHLAGNWQPIQSNHKQYFDDYLGYVCSNDSYRATEEELDRVTKLILGNYDN